MSEALSTIVYYMCTFFFGLVAGMLLVIAYVAEDEKKEE